MRTIKKTELTQTSHAAPGYTLRVSPRARNVNLRVTPEAGLTITVPRSFRMRELPAVLAEKEAWIRRSLAWAQEQRRLAQSLPPLVIPTYIDIPASGESWVLQMAATSSASTRVLQTGFRRLRLSGDIFNTEAAVAALRRWLSRRAREVLVPRLESLALSHRFGPVKKPSIRNQQTCWASYSPSGTISLNRKLLFLPPDLVDYILIHELCHSVHLDHSRRFWALVARCCPGYEEVKRSLADTRGDVPGWASD